MTSTNFVIGVAAESKNTSRVLRPPGGGHSDIFGLKEPETTVPRKEDNRRNASSILEGTNHVAVEKPTAECVKPETIVEKPIEPPKEIKEVKEVKHDAIPVANDNAPKKGKVPPGGFSSGFW